MRARAIAFIFLPLVLASSALAQKGADNDYSFEVITKKIVSMMVAGSDSYSVCEHVDRSNKPSSYVGKLIPASELPESSAIMARHLVVKRQGESIGVDLSIYRIHFPSNDAAIRTLGRIPAGRTGTVVDGKVLTRYAAQRDDHDIYIIRTQSFVDPAMRSFLESFARQEIKAN